MLGFYKNQKYFEGYRHARTDAKDRFAGADVVKAIGQELAAMGDTLSSYQHGYMDASRGV